MIRDAIEVTKESEKDGTEFFFKEDKAEGEFSFYVLKRILQGSGGSIYLFITYVIIPFYLIVCARKSRENLFDWGDVFYKDPDNPVKDSKILWAAFFWYSISWVPSAINKLTVFWSFLWLGRQLHSKMSFRLLHAKINNFLKRVPMGVFINRFSNDIDTVDKKMADNFFDVSFYIPKTCLNIYSVVDGLKTWFTIIPLLVYTAISVVMRNKYMNVKRDMARLFQLTRSPVIGLGAASISGGPVIRSLGNQKYIEAKSEHLIDENSKNRLIEIASDAWFEITLAVFNCFVVLLPSYGILVWLVYSESKKKTLDVEILGEDPSDRNLTDLSFFMVMIVAFSNDLTFLLKCICLSEGNFVSVERCCNFEQIEPEKGYKSYKEDERIFEEPIKSIKRARETLRAHERKNLFKTGEIEIKGVHAKYPTSREDVLKDINLHIKSGEKIGIVGRTGAGKSSFIKLLWRGLEHHKGYIRIDGINSKTVDLKEYRDQFTVISQQTSLFEGSIAINISPTPLKSEKIREIEDLFLRLKFPESKLEEPGLGFKLETDASNLSEGEKQILSFVRGVYNKRQIVIMDEASAYVDNSIEKEIRDITDQRFQGCTMFIIAHRIQSVMKCDKILVMGDGKVLEFDAPEVLLSDPNTEFSKICQRI